LYIENRIWRKTKQFVTGVSGELWKALNAALLPKDEYGEDVTPSHPHHTITDNLAAGMLSSLPYNLVVNGLWILVY